MKKLVLIFEKLYNYHLVKDVGQIPYMLGKYFDYNATICCQNLDRYEHLEDSVKGLKLDFCQSSYLYLFKNAKSINICMLFHIRAKSIYQGLFYKFLNPSGFLYVKSDLKDTHLPFINKQGRNVFAKLYNRFWFNTFVKKVDLVSFETEEVFNKINDIPDHKKLYLPNGFDSELPIKMGIVVKPHHKKDNTILCIARHGTEQKNSELLLQAVERIKELGTWQIIFAGPTTAVFEKYVDNFKLLNPALGSNIILTGEISDREQIFNLYNSAKIFCLPSRWESWGLVCSEALYFGSVLVMTRELISAPDLTNHGKAGVLAGNENVEEWATALKELMQNPERMQDLSNNGRMHFDNVLSWPKTLKKLTDRLPLKGFTDEHNP